MAIQVTYPGVYVQELPGGTHSIAGAPTTITAFIGYLRQGPAGEPVQCLTFGDFQRQFGGLDAECETSFQVSQFFLNGGSEAWIVRLETAPTGFDIAGSELTHTGVHALDAIPMVNQIVAPDIASLDAPNYLAAATALLNYAQARRAFVILDPPATLATVEEAADWATGVAPNFGAGTTNAAAYFPRVLVPSPFQEEPIAIGSGGTLAGLYAATDTSDGVWRAPAGLSAALAGVAGLEHVISDAENGQMAPSGMNALRLFPIGGVVSWGVRTLGSSNPANASWMYIPVRRLDQYIENSLAEGLRWVVFEPNDQRLWSAIAASANAFLNTLYKSGAFFGSSPAEAYRAVCDASTTSAQDIGNGVVNLLILFAPVHPAEFDVVTIQLQAMIPER